MEEHDTRNFSNKTEAFFKNKLVIFLALMATVLPMAACFVFILNYGVDIIYWDEWEMVAMYSQERISFHDLWSYHNEHRIFFPRIIYFSVAYLTGFNSKTQMFFSYAHILVAFFIFARYLKTVSEGGMYYFQLIVTSLVLFNLVQWENLLWGFQIGFFMCWFYSIVTLYFFHLLINNNNIKNLTLTIIFGFIASFSSMQGLLVWPAIIGLIIVYRIFSTARLGVRNTIVFLCAGIGNIILYFLNFDYNHFNRFVSSTKGYFLEQPLRFLGSAFRLVGCALAGPKLFGTSSNSDLYLVFGFYVLLILLVLTLLIAKKKISFDTKYVFCVGLIFYGVLFIGLISIGRANHVASRYMTFIYLLSIGLTLLICNIYKYKKNGVLTGFIIILIIAVLIGNIQAVITAGNIRSEWQDMRYYLTNYTTVPDENLEMLFPSASFVRSLAPFLEENEFSVFRDNAITNFISDVLTGR